MVRLAAGPSFFFRVSENSTKRGCPTLCDFQRVGSPNAQSDELFLGFCYHRSVALISTARVRGLPPFPKPGKGGAASGWLIPKRTGPQNVGVWPALIVNSKKASLAGGFSVTRRVGVAETRSAELLTVGALCWCRWRPAARDHS